MANINDKTFTRQSNIWQNGP